MPYRHHIASCLAENIGAGGLDQSDLDRLLDGCGPALARIKASHDDNSLPLLRLPARTDDIAAIEPIAERYCESFDDVVVLGTGGSSLAGRTLCALADRGFGPRPGAPRPAGDPFDGTGRRFVSTPVC